MKFVGYLEIKYMLLEKNTFNGVFMIVPFPDS
jgi:hypothetical protein